MSFVAETATVAHGYTMADLNRMAEWASYRHRTYGKGAISVPDKRDTAWHGVVECLYAHPSAPTEDELITAGLRAISEELDANGRHHGRNRTTGEEAIAFGKYWLPLSKGSQHHDFTEAVVERMALPQMLAQLTEHQYEAIATLAATGNSKDAARALGMHIKAFYSVVATARKQMLEVWFDDETPPARKSTRTHCNHGHARAEHGGVNSQGRNYCKLCMRNSQRRHYYEKRR